MRSLALTGLLPALLLLRGAAGFTYIGCARARSSLSTLMTAEGISEDTSFRFREEDYSSSSGAAFQNEPFRAIPQDLWREPPLLSGIRDQTGSCSVDIQLPDSFTAMERVAISSDGNLQRIVSSFYNAPVKVGIKRCQELDNGLFDREVDLSVLGTTFCTATSSLRPKTPDCTKLLRDKSMGLGQLFRYLGTYPSFRLLDAGKDSKEFWRLYELDCSSLTCRILERFALDTFSRASAGKADTPM